MRSVYVQGRSQPLKGQYVFAYRIRITNNSTRPVQLLRRHWIITDENGKTENVWWASLSLSVYLSSLFFELGALILEIQFGHLSPSTVKFLSHSLSFSPICVFTLKGNGSCWWAAGHSSKHRVRVFFCMPVANSQWDYGECIYLSLLNSPSNWWEIMRNWWS